MDERTSFLVTGLSVSTSCVSRGNRPSTSRSASSARLFDASTRFVRLGTAAGRLGWTEATRLRASSRVRIRGDSGKLPRIWMSLSVKSIASCGYPLVYQRGVGRKARHWRGGRGLDG